MEGLIIKALGGFYYVRTPQGDLECRARGIFRKEEVSPMVGDWVTVEPTQQGRGSLDEIHPRRNSLLRPPVANLDRLVLVVSAIQPAPNLQVIDKLTAIAACRDIPVVVVLSKIDLAQVESYRLLYEQCGYPVHLVNSPTGEGIEPLRLLMEEGLTVFCGNSGAGKSSLLNALYPDLTLATGEISKKLGRGRHTTRHVELFPTRGGYIADTPGFSAVEFLQSQRIPPRELARCFPEFVPYLGQCRFADCSHTSEKSCALLEAVRAGEIPESRHQSYRTIYDELKQVKEWEL